MGEKMMKAGLVGVAFFALTIRAMAFIPPADAVGPLRVSIEAPDKVDALDKPFDATVALTNSGSQTLEVRLEVLVIDDWRIEPDKGRKMEQALRLAANGKEQVALKLTAGAGTYNAHYPIHARVTFADPVSKESRQAHAIKILVVEAPRPPSSARPVEVKPGLTPLVRSRAQSVALRVGDEGATRVLGVGWRGSDAESGAQFDFAPADRGGRMESITVHPPYRKGWGNIWADYDLVLPDAKPIALTFSTAIRDNAANEPPSDGVEFRVIVGQVGNLPNAAPTDLFSRFTKSKTWEPATVDLSPFAGRKITLRLWSGPGPAHNTVCDTGYWGNPVIVVGEVPDRQSAQGPRNLNLETNFRGQTIGGAGRFGVSLSSPQGSPANAMITFAQEDKRLLVFRGMEVQIDGIPMDSLPIAEGGGWKWRREAERAVGEASLLCGGGPTRVRCDVWTEGGAMRFRFSMPDVKRDQRGRPRFTLLGLGPAPEIKGVRAKATRVYAGFGNVIENPGKFDLGANGFNLSTRHVGVEYDNGLSLVQACDVFPDRLHVDPEQLTWSLQTHHDATISLIPSEEGAFAAAKVYREGISGFKPAAGVAKLQGRMCLDYWGQRYEHGIQTVETLAKYGVSDCVYVWHNWQRWGYDYRLPEIYPARGSHEEFLKLAETCRKHGMLFSPHDNYIDFYPDAEGYSYDHIIFNEDGTPQRAWFNQGRQAQSYRWLPHAFRPWMEKNIALLNRDVKPTAYFIDVFTAIEPMDYYDRRGQFYPKTETIRRWSECWDYVREQFGGAPMISEAGHDSQIGHLDGGEADHNAVGPETAKQWAWRIRCADAERTPWHDMASHGSFVLFAGGLASRYVGWQDVKTHGYGSDDYLSLTVLGGRNPMAQGDSSAETILTYWLLHDVCKELGGLPMTSHEFGENVHRQIVRFGDGATVWVNRGADDWKIADAVLPPYGFVAKVGGVRAEVTRRDGVACGYAESGNVIFVDARPPRPSLLEPNKDRKVVDFGAVATNGAFRMTGDETTWRIVMLPGCPASEIRLHVSRMTKAGNARVAKIEKLNDDGTIAGPIEFKESNGDAAFQTSPGDFGYRVTRR